MTAADFLHINIRCADVEETRRFYETLVGLTVELAFVRLEGPIGS